MADLQTILRYVPFDRSVESHRDMSQYAAIDIKSCHSWHSSGRTGGRFHRPGL